MDARLVVALPRHDPVALENATMNLLVRRKLLVLLAGLAISLSTVAAAQEKTAPTNDAVVPVPRDGGWTKRHESFNERVKQGNVDLVFIGDSITQGWEGAGKGVWAEFYAKRNAVNLGIGGDRTQHVLWRLDHGNIDGIPEAGGADDRHKQFGDEYLRADCRGGKGDR